MKNQKTAKRNLWIVILIFGVLVLLSTGLFVYKTLTRFSYEQHFDDCFISVNEQKVTLREFGYYILLMEKDTQETALTYDSNQPKNYWNLYIGTEGKIGYVNEIAKEYAIDYCVRDLIYLEEMRASSFECSKEEKAEMESQAYELLDSFTEKQLSKVGMTEEAFLKEAIQIAEVYKYLESLTSAGIMADELDISGQYYMDLKNGKQIEINQELANQLSFGSITVND